MQSFVVRPVRSLMSTAGVYCWPLFISTSNALFPHRNTRSIKPTHCRRQQELTHVMTIVVDHTSYQDQYAYSTYIAVALGLDSLVGCAFFYFLPPVFQYNVEYIRYVCVFYAHDETYFVGWFSYRYVRQCLMKSSFSQNNTLNGTRDFTPPFFENHYRDPNKRQYK